MGLGFYAAAALLHTEMEQHKVIASNIASASKPGARQVMTSISSSASGKVTVPENFEAILEGQLPKCESTLNFIPGAIHSNGNPLSFAVSGQGFFEVQSPAGEKIYTRDGSFHLTPTYDLVDGYGNAVLGVDGPIQFSPEGGTIYADTSGQIFQGSQRVGQLSIMNIPAAGVMTVAGGYILDPAKGTPATPVEKPAVVQGAREESNFSIVEGMVQLIDTSRQHELGQQVIKNYDEREAKALEAFGRLA
jgi:flagellar basal-body rod protein FlgF